MIGGAFPGGVYGGYPVGLAPGAGYVPGGGFVPGGYRPGAAYPVGWTPTPGSGGGTLNFIIFKTRLAHFLEYVECFCGLYQICSYTIPVRDFPR